MKWIKKILCRWTSEGRELLENEDLQPISTSKVPRGLVRRADVDSDDGLNITVRKAIGGKIITFRMYDRKQDQNNYKLYVIPDDLDFDKELGKMITLESMRL